MSRLNDGSVCVRLPGCQTSAVMAGQNRTGQRDTPTLGVRGGPVGSYLAEHDIVAVETAMERCG